MTTTGSPQTLGARCARHPERSANVTCTRCGDFVCASCIGREGRCVACEETDVEPIRRAHIQHEVSVKSIGTLYWLFAFCAGVAAGFVLLGPGGQGQYATPKLFGFAFLLFAAALAVVGFLIRRFHPFGRYLATPLSGLGLLGFPIGTLIHGYILWLLWSKKGARVFQPDYPEIIAATPHVKARTGLVAWAALALLIFGCAGAIAFGMQGR